MKTSMTIRLKAFNISNFRSIIHSGWKSLTNDNITVLIGQNESGKTSVLESLKSFYDGIIHDDVLRSDLSLPSIACKFDLGSFKLSKVIEKEKVDNETYNMLSNMNEVTLTRTWNEQKTGILSISDDEIVGHYNKIKDQEKRIEEETSKKIIELLASSEQLLNKMKQAEDNKSIAQQDVIQIKKVLDDKNKKLKKARKADVKLLAEKDVEIAQIHYNNALEKLKQIVDEFENCKKLTQEMSEKVSVCKKCNTLVEELNLKNEELQNARQDFKDTEHRYEIATDQREKKLLMAKFDKCSSTLEAVARLYNQLKENLSLQKKIATKVLQGTKLSEAETEARNEFQSQKYRYTLNDLGEIIFKHLPVFLFFEDFSSLLPNKIDLEDLLNKNEHVEGYKAAQNFLSVAGLNAGFFREKNHRILKQKIENLNGDITINFQDYWSQNVGRNNKIRLNFELEHYDYRTPDKSGKPYIEFWIKDRTERLYPKQRSRGVRWFLSFYLELKAAAMQTANDKILLIDEPGVSLHAKAQEDVLKIFDNLKEWLQIIYCTHSPHLVDIEKMYRLLAVQRANENDDRSETLIYQSHQLSQATNDTLTPIYSLMGARINTNQVIQPRHNVLIADPINYYYLSALSKISDIGIQPYFIPATGLTNIGNLINIMASWQLGYMVLLFNSEASGNVLDEIGQCTIMKQNTEQVKLYPLMLLSQFDYIEDIFSTLDFKKYILNKRIGITVKNSEYIRSNNLSRNIMATNFITTFQEYGITLSSFDGETQENIANLFNNIKNLIISD